jgi:hypothetical protein
MEGADREGEYHLGLLSVGYSVCDTTLAMNTNPSFAQLAAAPTTKPEGTGVIKCVGAVVHSLGQEPGAVIINLTGPVTTSVGATSIHVVTADNSAIYALVSTPSATTHIQLGQSVRVIAMAP